MSDWTSIVDGFMNVRESVARMWPLMKRIPIIGGSDGLHGLELASFVLPSEGLHRLRYFVVHPATHVPFGCGETREAALSGARQIVLTLGRVDFALLVGLIADRVAKVEAEELNRLREAAREMTRRERTQGKVRSISRRRLSIFQKSDGKCHYCETSLDLDGKWHVEHKMPKALGGSNEPVNLVASCVPCNIKKHDRTDLEFISQRDNKGAA